MPSRLLPLAFLLACSDAPDTSSAVGHPQPGADQPDDLQSGIPTAPDTAAPDTGDPCANPVTWYRDADADGYGDPLDTVEACQAPSGYLDNADDCDDDNADIHPGLPDLCNSIDDDCDGDTDEDPDLSWYPDADCDGYGDTATATLSCEAVPDAVLTGDDCDDDDPSANPGVAGSCTAATGGTYISDMVMVAPSAGVDLADLASDCGGNVSRELGESGFGAISVPTGLDAQEFIDLLDADPDVQEAALIGRTDGKSNRAEPLQWHLDAIGAPDANSVDLSGVVIAVLDTGVAYEDYTDDSGQRYVQASSLATVDVVSPWDFVNDDAHPNDDNQHGTHIASIIASNGAVEGVAAGASLMPIKVLDAQNSGTELDLIEGIWHAIDNGADIINMSVAMRLGYEPSRALDEALTAADEAGIFMVGAAGNAAENQVAYPAAHPSVFAVAANTVSAGSGDEPTDYTNRGTAIKATAPGGDLDQDNNADGYPDGILAETISPATRRGPTCG